MNNHQLFHITNHWALDIGLIGSNPVEKIHEVERLVFLRDLASNDHETAKHDDGKQIHDEKEHKDDVE